MNLAAWAGMAGLITLAVALAAALYLGGLMPQPFINVLLWASVLAVVFYPTHRRIRARLQSATAAAAASTLLVLILILVPVTVLTIAVVRELSGAAAKLRGNTQLFSNRGTPLLGWLLDRVGEYVAIDRESARRFVAERDPACSRLTLALGSAGPRRGRVRWRRPVIGVHQTQS